MEIKNKLWIVEDKGKRFVFSTEEEGLKEWEVLSKKSEPKISELVFNEDNIEYQQVSWEKIAKFMAGVKKWK